MIASLINKDAIIPLFKELVMKIGGVNIDGPREEVMVIPYGDEQVVIKARAVLAKDYEDFNKLFPMPEAPEVIKRGGEKFRDVNDKEFNEKLNTWATKKAQWMALKSLEPSNIEWESVKMEDPETWGNYADELSNNFGDIVAGSIIALVHSACGLNQNKIEEATKRFLATKAEA